MVVISESIPPKVTCPISTRKIEEICPGSASHGNPLFRRDAQAGEAGNRSL